MSSSSRDATGGCRYERRREAQVWDEHSKAGTGVKRLESEGLESGLELGCSNSRINIRISIDRLSGRLIEVALFLKWRNTCWNLFLT
jgi:hypothetical protein